MAIKNLTITLPVNTHQRGMSLWYDYVDWIDGYPYEVATPTAVLDFYSRRSFMVEKHNVDSGRSGCNEVVFVRQVNPMPPKLS